MSKPQRAKATTVTAIKNAKPEAKSYKMSAGGGLYLLVNPSGGKLWRLKYRIHGTEKVMSFGAFPEVSLSQANKLMLEAKELLAKGIDPQEDKKAKEAEARAQVLTFQQVAERWYLGNTQHAVKPWATATARKARLYLDKDILPALGRLPIADITRAQLVRLNENIEKRGAIDIARKIREWLGAIFDEAYDREEIAGNPAYKLKASQYAKGAVSKPHPSISFEHLPQLLKDVEQSTSHQLVKAAIQMLTLTAVRPSELRFSTWAEFDLKNRLWEIPAERMKMRRPHTVPLPTQAIEILEQIKAINPDGYLFVIQGDKPFSENTLNKALKLAGYGGKQTGHGFRHLFSTTMNERNYNADWVEAQLAHKDSNVIRGTYNQATYLEQRTQMMQEWANSIDAAIAGGDITAIKRRA